MYYFTADEHFYHSKIIKYCKRPFRNIEHMHEILIDNFNRLVSKNDTTVHAGDFSYGTIEQTKNIIRQLNGSHIFLKGCHDRWLPKSAKYIYQKTFKELGKLIVISHYCMRTWKASHYNSYHLFAHSHGRLEAVGKSHDIGVDNNSFFPVNIWIIGGIMDSQPNNVNLVRK